VERWWKLAKHHALPLEDLARRFEEERGKSRNKKLLKEAMRGRWINSLANQELSERNPLKLVEALGLLKTLKVKVDSVMEEKLDQALELWEEDEDCEKALDKLNELRIVSKTRWKEWRKRRKRKSEEAKQSKQSKSDNPLRAEVLRMTKESWRKENQWRKRVQEWMANLEGERQEQQIKFEKKLRRCREPMEQLDWLEVEVFSNKPTTEE
jgi:hypothetical protein